MSCLSEEERGLSPLFMEILAALWMHKGSLGGFKHFPERPCLGQKVTREDFCSGYSDFEYVYMTILGLAKLHSLVEEITLQNNGQVFTRNPGVQLLERACGMTMHGDREGANALLRSAPAALLEAFQVAKSSGKMLDFFRNAFDRQADPCLEGRTSRLLQYLEKHRHTATTMAPWEDVSLQRLPNGASSRDIAGEHLRVFCNECTWLWSRQRRLSYEDAKAARFGSDANLAEDFARVFNAQTFREAMRARGVVRRSPSVQWEVQVENGSWAGYEAEASAAIEAAHSARTNMLELRLGPRGWKYVIDLGNKVQLNPKTRKSRPIRRQEAPISPSSPSSPSPGSVKLTEVELEEAVQFFVDMQTLPPHPP
ncbi:unnamed protein product [Symbiodinium natans]|uniref:WWE domain-containing protein n=1 Tax=Symbiodinium natans TaxID=878477 RepID=A0A812NBY2_9DINO|nr:unnamed protein product [Symbiodinium natans]